MLFEKAKRYETTSFKGLYNFISFIDKLKLSSGDMSSAKIIGENEDVVRIMSIHKSKGLEFPVVFLCEAAKQFNMQDLNKNLILLHQDLGLGPKYINYEEGETYDTVAKEAVKIKAKEEMISEEMRVLYVALTRAKEKLIITGIEKDYKKSILQKETLLKSYKEKEVVNKNITQRFLCYLNWIELVYLKRSEELKNILDIKVHNKNQVLKSLSDKSEKEEFDIKEKIKNIDQNELEKIKEKLEWEYEYNGINNIFTKSSVTKIKNMKLDLEEEEITEYKVPEFMQNTEKLTGAERGTLMHLILQKLDINMTYDENEVRKLVSELKEKDIISDMQEEAVDIKKVISFTKTKIWNEMKKAKEVEREKNFYINIPAKEIYGGDIDENILVQGVIDLYYVTDKDEVVLVDYKTDRFNNEIDFINRYKEQLMLYKRALSEAKGKGIDRVYIYSVYLEKEILVSF